MEMILMKYFRFFPDVHFIKGLSRGTIYHFSESRVYQLSTIETHIVNELDNKPIEEVLKQYGKTCENLTNTLIKDGFGSIFDYKVFSEPYNTRSNFQMRGFFEPRPPARMVFIQINSNCDANCDFCASHSYLYFQGCNSCLRKPVSTTNYQSRLTVEKLYDTINKLCDIEMPLVIFSGGNPLLEWEELIKISKEFRYKNSSIELRVITSGSELTENKAKQASEFNISFLFNIFGTNEEETYIITNRKGLFDEFIQAINYSRKYDIKFAININIYHDSIEQYKKMYEFAKSFKPFHIFTTEIIPYGKKRKILSMPTGRERLENIDSKSFFNRKHSNFCLCGTIAISCDGSILPCPNWKLPIGSIYDKKGVFSVFFNDSIRSYWEYTKDCVPICKDCENRYSCADCSVIEWEMNNDVSLKNIICDYSPQSGKWENEEEKVILCE